METIKQTGKQTKTELAFKIVASLLGALRLLIDINSERILVTK